MGVERIKATIIFSEFSVCIGLGWSANNFSLLLVLFLQIPTERF